MELRLNGIGQTDAHDIVCFTDIPNILKLTDTAGGTCAVITFVTQGDISQMSAEATITLFGETITGVKNASDAINKNFWMSSSPTNTMVSIVKALRNCPTVSTLFNVYFMDGVVQLKARNYGVLLSKYPDYFTTSIPSTYITILGGTDGTASSLNGALVNVQINKSSDYVTTLEKSFYKGECAFNLSPVLTTMAKVGETTKYNLKVSYIKDGVYHSVATIQNNYIAQGYMCNQGKKYIDLNGEAVIMAMNYKRGEAKGTSNRTIFYLYGDKIPLSFYRNGSQTVAITVTYRNSALAEITSSTYTYTATDNINKLRETTVLLDNTLLKRSFYVDVLIGGHTLRYTVIKPIKATEYYQRILWRNSYGGISFVDETGGKTENHELSVETYQKNIYDYYDSDKNVLDKVYDNKVNYTVTLKSHLMEKDGMGL